MPAAFGDLLPNLYPHNYVACEERVAYMDPNLGNVWRGLYVERMYDKVDVVTGRHWSRPANRGGPKEHTMLHPVGTTPSESLKNTVQALPAVVEALTKTQRKLNKVVEMRTDTQRRIKVELHPEAERRRLVQFVIAGSAPAMTAVHYGRSVYRVRAMFTEAGDIDVFVAQAGGEGKKWPPGLIQSIAYDVATNLPWETGVVRHRWDSHRTGYVDPDMPMEIRNIVSDEGRPTVSLIFTTSHDIQEQDALVWAWDLVEGFDHTACRAFILIVTEIALRAKRPGRAFFRNARLTSAVSDMGIPFDVVHHRDVLSGRMELSIDRCKRDGPKRITGRLAKYDGRGYRWDNIHAPCDFSSREKARAVLAEVDRRSSVVTRLTVRHIVSLHKSCDGDDEPDPKRRSGRGKEVTALLDLLAAADAPRTVGEVEVTGTFSEIALFLGSDVKDGLGRNPRLSVRGIMHS